MTDRIYTLSSNLGEDIEVFAARLSTGVAALGGVSPVDFTIRMETQGVYKAVLVYRPGGLDSQTLAVVAFKRRVDPTASTDAMNAFFTANSSYRGVFIRSIAPQDDRDLLERQLVAVYSTGPLAQIPTGEQQVYAAENGFGNIAPGASASVTLYDGNGVPVDTVTAENRSTNVWTISGWAIVYYDLESQAWFAYPGCC